MNSSRIVFKIIALLLACFAVFLPRILSLEKDWSTDEARWLSRSNTFIQALFQGNFRKCLQSYHPGVTTMWIGGLEIWAKYKDTLGIPGDALLSKETLALARIGIALTTALSILLIAYMLYKLYNAGIAFLTAILLAFDPFYLAQSRRLHTDALIASFLTITILALLIYLNVAKKKYLIISGICFGLACLSKSTAVAALPYVLFLFLLYISNISVRLFDSQRPEITRTYMINSLVVWVASACLTFLALWPIFWDLHLNIEGFSIPYFGVLLGILLLTIIWNYKNLRPNPKHDKDEKRGKGKYLCYFLSVSSILVGLLPVLGVTTIYIRGIQSAIIKAHNVPHLFWGRIVSNPGSFFYPVMAFVHSSPLILFLVPLGGFLLWDYRHQAEYSKIWTQYLIFLSFIAFYCVCMSIGAKKFTRYVLPIFPFLDILAALSLYMAIKFIRENYLDQYIKKISVLAYILVLIPGSIVAYHIYSVVSLHPHYFSYINPFLTPHSVVSKFSLEDGQGLDPAAEYLNKKLRAEEMTVCVSPLGSERFAYYFVGKTLSCNGMQPTKPHEYEVVYVRDLQINWYKKKWDTKYLEKIITINNIDYAWIYRVHQENRESLR